MVVKVGSPGLSYFSKEPPNIYHNRCVKLRMGRSPGRADAIRIVASRTGKLAYKPEGVVCSASSGRTQSQEIKEQVCLSAIRQQKCGCIPEQTRGHKVAESPATDGGSLVDDAPSKYFNQSPIHSGKVQHDSRQSVKRDSDPGLAHFLRGPGEDFPTMGDPGDRLICDCPIGGGSAFCGADGAGAGCSFDAKSVASSEFGTRVVYCDSPEMGKSILESGPEEQGHQASVQNSESERSPDRFADRTTTTSGDRIIFGGLEDSGWSNQVSQWNVEDRRLLESAWRKSTWASYRAPWRRWVEWATSNGLSINNPSPQDLALYLSHLHRDVGMVYASILVHKSVVSTFADPNDGSKLSSHPIVLRMLKAIGVKKPERKRTIWDIRILIDWLRDNPPNEDSLFQVARHVAVLMIVMSGRRIHDLTLLSIEEGNFCDRGNYVIFWPKFGSKTDGVNYQQSGWKFNANPERIFNVITWIRKLVLLAERRKGSLQTIKALFITTRGKVQPASRTVIGGWFKTIFKDLGLDVSPGSCRAAVASARYANDTPLDIILKQANWKGDTNFFKHYCKEVTRSQGPDLNKCNEIEGFEAV